MCVPGAGRQVRETAAVAGSVNMAEATVDEHAQEVPIVPGSINH